MTTYNKTKNEDFNAQQLQSEINANSGIVPSCLSITSNGDDLTLDFAADLSGGEETELDTVITNHVPLADIVNAALLPKSDLEGDSLAVHPSYKPRINDGTTYAVWTGSGDDIGGGIIGGGELLHFDMTNGTPEVIKDIKFDHANHGRVWIHEAYLKFTGAGEGDYLSADVMATATPLQTSVNLDLEIDGMNCVKYAAGGPGTGTHGFGGTPTLVPRTFSMDGHWDFDGVNLTPNFAGTGEYWICDIDRSVHRYVNKIPMFGDCPYFSMSSDETAELLTGYFLRVTVTNGSDSDWHMSVIMEIYREKTI